MGKKSAAMVNKNKEKREARKLEQRKIADSMSCVKSANMRKDLMPLCKDLLNYKNTHLDVDLYIHRAIQSRFTKPGLVKLCFVFYYLLISERDKTQAPPEVISPIVYKALDLGYRHIDTAFNYNNEEAIGKAVEKWIADGKGIRKDLFITTKLPHVGNRPSDVKKFLTLQLERLKMDYVDLYLIHVPFGFHCDLETLTPVIKDNGDYDLDMETNHVATWKKMEECQKEGLVRNIGLSNFNEKQILKLIQASSMKPQVLQVELHASFQQTELRRFCAEHDIVVTAYAPLGSPGAKEHFVNKYKYSPDAFPNLMELPEVKDLAKKYGKTPAQILLNFLIQLKIVVIPKSVSENRLKENMELFDFELTPAEINRLQKLDKGEKGRIFNFLFWKGVENHPEYPFKLPVKDLGDKMENIKIEAAAEQKVEEK